MSINHRELQTIGALAHGQDLLRKLVLKVLAAHTVRRLFRQRHIGYKTRRDTGCPCCAHLCAFLCMLDSTRRQVEVAGIRRMQDVAIDASHRCLV